MKKLVFIPIAVMLMFSACSNDTGKTSSQNESSNSEQVSVSKDGIKAIDGDTKVDISANGSIDVKSDDANVNIKDGNVSVSDGSGSGVSIGKDGINISSDEGNVNINVDTDLKKYVIDDSKSDLIKKGMTYEEMIKVVGISPFNPANVDISKGEVEVQYFNSELDSITVSFVDGVVDSVSK